MFVRRQPPSYAPAVGDIIVFSNPERTPLDQAGQLINLLVKRVIALPGQQVEVKNGQVWINGTPLSEPYLNEPILYQLPPQTVPQGQLFVLGDNRNSSRDSRVWGFLPRPHVIGNAYKITGHRDGCGLYPRPPIALSLDRSFITLAIENFIA